MSAGNDSADAPKSMRHKQILDVAADNPGASMDELASMVPSATTELVERVLDKYGDPAAENDDGATESDSTASDEDDEAHSTTASDSTTESEGETSAHEEPGAESQANEESSPSDDSSGSAMADAAGEADTAQTATTQDTETTTADDQERSQSSTQSRAESDGEEAADDSRAADESGTADVPSKDELTEKQLAVLKYIAAHPGATQREIGEELGVSSATVNNRVNSIDGFEWTERRAFVESLFEYRGSTASSEDVESASTEPAQSSVEELATRLDTLEQRIDTDCGSSDGTASVFDDPDLVHKVVHACLESDRLSEDEELCILREILE